jgi:hypothetical protein
MLAHTIREIEEDIFQKSLHREYGVNYRIQIRTIEDVERAICCFSDCNCTIFLPKKMTEGCAPSTRDVKDMRILLAHELGHVVANIDAIIEESRSARNPKYSAEEEANAWRFALDLLWHKNVFLEKKPYDDFKYSSRKELVGEIKYFIRTRCRDDVKAELKKQKSELAE